MNIDDLRAILEVLGYLWRPFGVLVFGVATGWMTVRTFKMETLGWPLPVVAFVGLLGAFVLLGHWVPGAGTFGMFALGAGGAVIFWGLIGERKPKEEEDED
jgi:hypothetical protein